MRLFCLVTMLMFCTFLYGQGGADFTLNGSGARAAGMGYAFTGISDDATAISWNPAGLTQLYSMEASLIGRFGFGFLSTNYSEFNPETKIGSKFQLNFASFVLPFSSGDLNMVGGIAFRRLYDFTQDWTVTIDEEVEGVNVFAEDVTDNSGGINAISPAFSVQLTEMFSVGATLNILMGSTDYSNSFRLEIEGISSEEYESTYSESYSGTSADLGVMVKPNEKVSIGGSFKLPHTIEVEEEEEGETYTAEAQLPFMFDLGLGFRASEKVLLAFDYHHRPISELTIKPEAGEEFKPFSKDENPELKDDLNGSSIHAGLEYLAQSGENIIPLRAGFFTYPTTDLDDNYEQVKYLGVAAGMGIVMDKIILDGSFEWILGSFIGDTEEDGSDVDYTYNEFRITIGAVMHLGK
jgi:hypothetical protein